ncbi:MAG: acyl-CoA thioesterase [Desulfobulbaceae bacterium]|jgi:acyl-CoA thioester hydrolase|nr:acyl-CoA thioesterase [Desulfobulbaceae bacterium]
MDESRIHRCQTRVLYSDTDSGGGVYNANYLRFFEVGRGNLMRDWLVSHLAIEKMGFYLPLTESWLRYKAPARYDDLIVIETSIAEVVGHICTFAYKIVRAEEGLEKPRLLCKGYTVHVATDINGKLTSLPQELINQMAGLVNPTPPARRFGAKSEEA